MIELTHQTPAPTARSADRHSLRLVGHACHDQRALHRPPIGRAMARIRAGTAGAPFDFGKMHRPASFGAMPSPAGFGAMPRAGSQNISREGAVHRTLACPVQCVQSHIIAAALVPRSDIPSLEKASSPPVRAEHPPRIGVLRPWTPGAGPTLDTTAPASGRAGPAGALCSTQLLRSPNTQQPTAPHAADNIGRKPRPTQRRRHGLHRQNTGA